MKNFLCLGRGINVLPLALELLRQDHLWREDTYLRDYPQGPFKDVETVFLRFPTASVSELERSRKDPHECAWMDGALHLPSARPLIFALLTQVQGERLGRVMVNKIRPGGQIYPHADTPGHAAYYSRFHYVVMSAPGVQFRCGEETVGMQSGDLWWFNNALEHHVINNSSQDRIHLIIDIRTQHLAFKGLTPTTLEENSSQSVPEELELP